MNISTGIGIVAGMLTTIAFIPQVVQVFTNQNLSAISIPFIIIFALGVLLWTIYGIFLHNYVIITFNAIVCASAIIILIQCFRYHYLTKF